MGRIVTSKKISPPQVFTKIYYVHLFTHICQYKLRADRVIFEFRAEPSSLELRLLIHQYPISVKYSATAKDFLS